MLVCSSMLITEVAKESVNSIDRNLGERTRLFSNLIVLLLPEDEGVYEEEEPSISITSKSGSIHIDGPWLRTQIKITSRIISL